MDALICDTFQRHPTESNNWATSSTQIALLLGVCRKSKSGARNIRFLRFIEQEISKHVAYCDLVGQDEQYWCLRNRHLDRAANAPTTAQYLRSSNLAKTKRCITANTIAAETPNMSAPFVASSGPSNRHDGVRSTSP
jgi:hypothetical protein